MTRLERFFANKNRDRNALRAKSCRKPIKVKKKTFLGLILQTLIDCLMRDNNDYYEIKRLQEKIEEIM